MYAEYTETAHVKSDVEDLTVEEEIIKWKCML